jgi:hypothetical protein
MIVACAKAKPFLLSVMGRVDPVQQCATATVLFGSLDIFPLAVFWIVVIALAIISLTLWGNTAFVALIVGAAMLTIAIRVKPSPFCMQFALFLNATTAPVLSALKTPWIVTISVACINGIALDWLLLTALLAYFRSGRQQIGLHAGMLGLIRGFHWSIARAFGVCAHCFSLRRNITRLVMRFHARLTPRHTPIVTLRAPVKILDWLGFATLCTRFHRTILSVSSTNYSITMQNGQLL